MQETGVTAVIVPSTVLVTTSLLLDFQEKKLSDLIQPVMS
jgi:gamma-glutamyltranspeptidase